MNRFNYLLSNAAKFHHFEIAKELYKRKQLSQIVCGYPWFKLKYEKIPKHLVEAHGFFNILHFFFRNYRKLKFFSDYIDILNNKYIDNITSKYINRADVLIALSGTGLNTGKKIIKNNKIYICERSSSHIIFQNNILSEEYKEFGQPKFTINKWVIDRELQEYENANIILVPSLFAKKSFEDYLPNSNKVHAINFGVNLQNFYPINSNTKNKDYFDILFIGNLSIQKGLHYLIEAFNKFNHPKKRLHLVGSSSVDKKFFSNQLNNDNILIYGHIPHLKLKEIINKSDIFVLPSLQEGFATVTLQALACGCPVIVSENTGAAEFVRENKCGFVVPIRNSQIISDKLTLLSDNRQLLEELSNNALKISKKNSWGNYVDQLDQLVVQFKK